MSRRLKIAVCAALLQAGLAVGGPSEGEWQEGVHWARALAAPQMSRRQTYQGGWAMGLSGSTCPSDQVQCKGSLSNPACCPQGSTCGGSYTVQYCCPSGVSCESYLRNFPQCADPKNTLYMIDKDFFCCPLGEFGVLPLQGYGGFCQTEGSAVAQSRIATKASEAKTTVVATTRTSSTVLVTSTNANGLIVTITTVTTGRATVTLTSNVFDTTNVAAGTGGSQPTQTSSGNSPTSGTSNNSPQGNGNNNGGGISAGAIAGIVIGALGVIGIFALAFVIYRRRRPAPISHPSPSSGAGPAPDYSTYAPPTHQQQPDMTNYPIPVDPKSPALSQAALNSTAGGRSPAQGTVSPQHSGYGPYGPPPFGGAVEAPGQNTWNGASVVGSGHGR